MGDHHAVLDWWSLFVGIVLASLKGRRAVVVEDLLRRQQLSVAVRAQPHPRIRRRDRLFWVVARRLVADWRRHRVLVRPETVLRGHRRGGAAGLVVALWPTAGAAPGAAGRARPHPPALGREPTLGH